MSSAPGKNDDGSGSGPSDVGCGQGADGGASASSASDDGDSSPSCPVAVFRSSSDRVVIDVGGTEFVASRSTLARHSAHFAKALGDDGGEAFLDQDPAAFAGLLAFMRTGLIRVDDIDTGVLVLAELLGVERLVRAVKIRWHVNIGSGPAVSTDDEIVAAFDSEHGGIIKAISSGLFPHFQKRNEIDAEKDLGIMTIFSPDKFDETTVSIKEVGMPTPERGAKYFVAALNVLHSKGYCTHEGQLDKSNRYENTLTFSRRRHRLRTDSCANILIPTDEEIAIDREAEYAKQFAVLMEETDRGKERIIAPAEFIKDPQMRDPFAVILIDGRRPWLENNGFLTREEGYESLFEGDIKSMLEHCYPDSRGEAFRRCRIYSRRVRREL